MAAPAYAALNDGTHVMDGQRAWRHLTQELGMRAVAADSLGPVSDRFDAWCAEHANEVTVRGGQPTFLIPPRWYFGDTT